MKTLVVVLPCSNFSSLVKDETDIKVEFISREQWHFLQQEKEWEERELQRHLALSHY